MTKFIIAFLILIALNSCSIHNNNSQLSELQKQVFDRENAFAKSMKDRDYQAFTSFIADEAIFFSGDKPLKGKQEVLKTWKAYYESDSAPFSWQADIVEILESGDLALSNGPVYNSKGELFAKFTSIWKRDHKGLWYIVFDKGNTVCKCD